MSDPMMLLARRIGTTPGQAWTLSLGFLLAVLLLTTSLPPVLDQRAAPRPIAAALPTEAPQALLGQPVPDAATEPGVTDPGGPDPLAPLEPLLPAPPAAPLLPPALGEPFSPAAPAPAAGGAPPAPFALPPPPPAVAALTVREGGWSVSGPPTAAVPKDGLPVGALLGSEREQAYVRLTGTGTELVLALVDDEGASVNPAGAAVRACRILDAGWTAQRPGPAVDFDPGDCVAAEPGPDSTFRFGLAAYPDRTGSAGFALVLDGSAPTTPPRTFRLTFLVPEMSP